MSYQALNLAIQIRLLEAFAPNTPLSKENVFYFGQQPIGLFGHRHLNYLKQHHRVTYINLLTSGKFNTYLAAIINC